MKAMKAASLLVALGSHPFATAKNASSERPGEERELRLFGPRPGPRPICPDEEEICFVFEGGMGIRCETMHFFLENPDPYPMTTTYAHSLAGLGVNIPGNLDIGLDYDYLNDPGGPNYIFVGHVDVPDCPRTSRRCLLDCSRGGPAPSPTDPPFCDAIACQGRPPTPPPVTVPTPTPPPVPTVPGPTPRPTPWKTPRPTARTCPDDDDIWFLYEGAAGIRCETMSFYLEPSMPDASYSWSLAGAGNDIPGHENIGLTLNPVINSKDPNRNYVFVAKAEVPGCPAAVNACLLDCVRGGAVRSPSDPPFCDDVRRKRALRGDRD